MRTRGQKISIDLKRRAIAEAIFKTQIKCPASAFLCRFYPIHRGYPCRLRWDGIFAKKERLWRHQNRFESPPKLNRSKAKLKIFYLAGVAARVRIACKGILRRYVSKHHRKCGRAETQEAIEMIALRLVAKNSGAATWENFLRDQR